MQNKTVEEMSDYVIDEMRNFFGKRVKGFVVKDIVEDANHKSFIIEFNAYDYFPVIFNYDMGRISCSIIFCIKTIELKNSQKWWEEAELNKFFKELKYELEIRIPDKYLIACGWM